MVSSILAACMAAAILALVFVGGLRRGMDHVAMFGPENEQAAIAIALSDVVYHLNAGYVGYATVRDKLVEIWNRGASSDHDPILIQNGANRDLLNEGIRAAASLGPQQPAFVGNRSLITMLYTDIGSVDLDKLAFRLFGLKIESRYYTFFVLLALSAAAYLIVFRAQLLAKIVLLCSLFAFYIEMHTVIFDPNMPTFSSERHGSTLALIPLWHFTFLLIYRHRPSAITVLATLIQLVIMLLAIKIRGAAGWVVIFVAVVSCAVAFLEWRQMPSEERNWLRLLRAAGRWPLVILAGGVLVNGQYVKSTLHPVYFTDDVIPYHGLWSAAFVGILVFAPELMPKNSKATEVARNIGIDAATMAATLEYLNDTRFIPLPPDYPHSIPPSLISPWTATYKSRFIDDIMRGVVLRIAVRHPFALFKLYFYEKPYRTFLVLSDLLGASPTRKWFLPLLLGGVVSFGVLFITGSGQDLKTGNTLILIAASLPFAALPDLWAWPARYSIADLLLITFVLGQLLVCGAMMFFLAKLRSRRTVAREALPGQTSR
jgi:hypothetical protein